VNPCELAIDLFCRGLRVDPSATLARSGRPVARERAGLGSGLELVIPGAPPVHKDVWVNVPVDEAFARGSPYVLRRREGYEIVDERTSASNPVVLPPAPDWYRRRTSTGVRMRRVGVLQGTYLGVYLFDSCAYWRGAEPCACRFCTTGLNVGPGAAAHTDLASVVEVAAAAKAESGVTFVHLNTGYQKGRALRRMLPYVRALKERVGMLVGVQALPEGVREDYDRLLDAGCDHLSFCWELHDPGCFARYCPGKHATLGQRAFFEALEHCQGKMPRGACSGEIIAGLEPLESSLEAIDYITGVGAFPTVCIFRPLLGSALADAPPPDPAGMRVVMRHVWERCRDRDVPIGLAPNIEVSLVVQPTDAAYLSDWTWRDRWYAFRLGVKKRMAAPVFRRRMRARYPLADS